MEPAGDRRPVPPINERSRLHVVPEVWLAFDQHLTISSHFESQEGWRGRQVNDVDTAPGGAFQPHGQCRQRARSLGQDAHIEVARRSALEAGLGTEEDRQPNVRLTSKGGDERFARPWHVSIIDPCQPLPRRSAVRGLAAAQTAQ